MLNRQLYQLRKMTIIRSYNTNGMTHKSARIIRKEFLEYFTKDLDHTFVPSSPVLPINDPALPFVNAGMNQVWFFHQQKKISMNDDSFFLNFGNSYSGSGKLSLSVQRSIFRSSQTSRYTSSQFSKMYKSRRQTQRPWNRRTRYLSPYLLRNAWQLVLWRLFQGNLKYYSFGICKNCVS